MEIKTTRIAGTLTLLGCLVLIAMVLWSHEGEDHGTPASTVGGLGPVVLSPEARRDLGVTTEEVVLRTIEETAPAFGVIEALPDSVFWASTRISGRAVAVNYTAGDTVRKGNILAEVESRHVAAKPARVPVRSLIDGTVTERLISVGEPVEPNSVLFRVVNLARVYARLDLYEVDAGRVQAGQRVRIYPEAAPTQIIEGFVALVGAGLDRATRTLPVWVELANPQRTLRPGMRIRGELVIGASREVVSVPRAAILGSSGNLFVFLDKGDYFLGQPVGIGRRDREQVEITDGLLPGDLAVTRGAYQLQFAAAQGGDEADYPGRRGEPAEEASLAVEEAANPKTAAAGVRLSHLAEANLGIATEEVDFRVLDKVVRCFGSIEALPTSLHRISTRIAGRISAVYAAEGQKVGQGQQLAAIESLQIADPPPIVTVPSTLAGIVLERHVFLGEPVDPNKTLFTIVTLDEVLVKCHVYEADIASVQIGQAVRIRTEAFPGRVFEGRLKYFGGQIDSATRTLPAFVRVKNPQGLLRPNMRAEAYFVVGQRDETIAIATSALLDPAGERPFVFVRDGDIYKRQTVVVGERDDRFVEIVEGLLPGDLVVVERASGLKFATDSPQRPEAPSEGTLVAAKAATDDHTPSEGPTGLDSTAERD